jgi:hypothetical protein
VKSVQWLGYDLDDPGFESRHQQHILLSPKFPEQVMGTKQLYIKWVPEALPPVVKWPQRDADQSRSSSAGTEKEFSYTVRAPPPYMSSWRVYGL